MGEPATQPSTDTLARPSRSDNSELARVLSAQLGIDLTPREFTLADGTRVGVDAADGNPPKLLVQCSPVQGQVKSAQRNKVIADAFKLSWLRDTHFPDARLLLVLGEPLAKLFGRGAWLPSALASHGITVALVDEGQNVRMLDIGT
ncbi:hypothetical protein ACOALZ_16050 [Nocardiopsis algeriensis]|uniref:hypothetical protein n=1 Tax=Nocardiopsis algeriensis TaxID=1478215 RepID=UPI003B434549